MDALTYVAFVHAERCTSCIELEHPTINKIEFRQLIVEQRIGYIWGFLVKEALTNRPSLQPVFCSSCTQRPRTLGYGRVEDIITLPLQCVLRITPPRVLDKSSITSFNSSNRTSWIPFACVVIINDQKLDCVSTSSLLQQKHHTTAVFFRRHARDCPLPCTGDQLELASSDHNCTSPSLSFNQTPGCVIDRYSTNKSTPPIFIFLYLHLLRHLYVCFSYSFFQNHPFPNLALQSSIGVCFLSPESKNSSVSSFAACSVLY